MDYFFDNERPACALLEFFLFDLSHSFNCSEAPGMKYVKGNGLIVTS